MDPLVPESGQQENEHEIEDSKAISKSEQEREENDGNEHLNEVGYDQMEEIETLAEEIESSQNDHETNSELYLTTGCSEAESADELDGISPITFMYHLAVLAILSSNDNEIDRKNIETIYFFIVCLYYSYQSDEVHTRWRQHNDKSEYLSLQYESSLILDSMLPRKFEKTSDIQNTGKDKPNVTDNKYKNYETASFNQNRVDNNLKNSITYNSVVKNQAGNKGNEKLTEGNTGSHLYKKDTKLTNDNEVACDIRDLTNFDKQTTANTYDSLKSKKSLFESFSCNNHLKNKTSLITVAENDYYHSNYERTFVKWEGNIILPGLFHNKSMLYPCHPGYLFNGTLYTLCQKFEVYIAIGDTRNEKYQDCNNADEESCDNHSPTDEANGGSISEIDEECVGNDTALNWVNDGNTSARVEGNIEDLSEIDQQYHENNDRIIQISDGNITECESWRNIDRIENLQRWNDHDINYDADDELEMDDRDDDVDESGSFQSFNEHDINHDANEELDDAIDGVNHQAINDQEFQLNGHQDTLSEDHLPNFGLLDQFDDVPQNLVFNIISDHNWDETVLENDFTFTENEEV